MERLHCKRHRSPSGAAFDSNTSPSHADIPSFPKVTRLRTALPGVEQQVDTEYMELVDKSSALLHMLSVHHAAGRIAMLGPRSSQAHRSIPCGSTAWNACEATSSTTAANASNRHHHHNAVSPASHSLPVTKSSTEDPFVQLHFFSRASTSANAESQQRCDSDAEKEALLVQLCELYTLLHVFFS